VTLPETKSTVAPGKRQVMFKTSKEVGKEAMNVWEAVVALEKSIVPLGDGKEKGANKLDISWKKITKEGPEVCTLMISRPTGRVGAVVVGGVVVGMVVLGAIVVGAEVVADSA